MDFLNGGSRMDFDSETYDELYVNILMMINKYLQQEVVKRGGLSFMTISGVAINVYTHLIANAVLSNESLKLEAKEGGMYQFHEVSEHMIKKCFKSIDEEIRQGLPLAKITLN